MKTWAVMEDQCNMALVLSDMEGRRAYFAYSDLADVGPPPAYTRYSNRPFAGLLWAIENGLRPYKTFGGEIAGLPAPSLLIGHES